MFVAISLNGDMERKVQNAENFSAQGILKVCPNYQIGTVGHSDLILPGSLSGCGRIGFASPLTSSPAASKEGLEVWPLVRSSHPHR